MVGRNAVASRSSLAYDYLGLSHPTVPWFSPEASCKIRSRTNGRAGTSPFS